MRLDITKDDIGTLRVSFPRCFWLRIKVAAFIMRIAAVIAPIEVELHCEGHGG